MGRRRAPVRLDAHDKVGQRSSLAREDPRGSTLFGQRREAPLQHRRVVQQRLGAEEGKVGGGRGGVGGVGWGVRRGVGGGGRGCRAGGGLGGAPTSSTTRGSCIARSRRAFSRERAPDAVDELTCWYASGGENGGGRGGGGWVQWGEGSRAMGGGAYQKGHLQLIHADRSSLAALEAAGRRPST